MIEKRHVDLVNREIRFKIGEDKTSGKTGKPRVIHLNDAALDMISRLICTHPTGPLFRNMKGQPWNSDSMNCATRQGAHDTVWVDVRSRNASVGSKTAGGGLA